MSTALPTRFSLSTRDGESAFSIKDTITNNELSFPILHLKPITDALKAFYSEESKVAEPRQVFVPLPG